MTRLALAACVLVPLLWSLWATLTSALDAQAWAALWTDPQTWAALRMSLWTGMTSSLLACGTAAWMASAAFTGTVWPRLLRWLAPMLAVPHAAFAIGMVALLAPSGWVLRALSPWATGMDAPPPWPTTQDPWGLALIAALALKEIPFLLWCAAAWLQRPDVGQRLRRELQVAATLGYTPGVAWWRVALPQLAPRLAAPALAVGAYSLTVVDMVLVIGPASPPTLAVLAWQWLQDADTARNAQGAAAAWVLALAVAALALTAMALSRSRLLRGRWSAGVPAVQADADAHTALPPSTPTHTDIAPVSSPSSEHTTVHAQFPHTVLPRFGPPASCAISVLAGAYACVLLALLLGSVVGSWPFPALWPDTWTLDAWRSVLDSAGTVHTTLWLAVASSGTALVWVVAWLEFSGNRRAAHPHSTQGWRHALLQCALYLPLVLPSVLWVAGLHQMALTWGIGGTAWGVWLAHTLACVPYVYLALLGPYAGVSQRGWHIAASLGHGRWTYLWRIQWPLLRAALWSAFAVGCAVSVAQYLPTLYVGAGRFDTVTIEAVTLASGGQRSLTAAFAWLQWLLPVLVFAIASRAGRPRRFARINSPN